MEKITGIWIDHRHLKIVSDFEVDFETLVLYEDDKRLSFVREEQHLKVDVDVSPKKQYVLELNNKRYAVVFDWQFVDAHYSTDEALGLRYDEFFSLSFWSISATEVSLVIYDKTDDKKQLSSHPLKESDNVWKISNIEEVSNISDLSDYYYHLKIVRHNKTIYALDPYAQSMSVWNVDDVLDDDLSNPDNVAKAAFIKHDPEVMTFAEIDNYRRREDAIIYEVHVRDFTSDLAIRSELENSFGTFDAFIERLDYIKDLGVTHIQLLPIMSYYNINESEKHMFNEDPSAYGKNSHYNWGYDPHSYFSISGMYAEDASVASERIEAFKRLVKEIHKRKMGVILDVVYNHTARLHILESLQPHYYHFMNQHTEAKTSFGGGRLASTHKMASRIIKDSLVYWTKVFHVDGFRFDMMGDHDAQSIQEAYDLVSVLNPKVLMLGEGWMTYVGDDDMPQQAADQSWVKDSEAVGVFSDEYRNVMKSGFESEGTPKFLTGEPQNIQSIFNNITANPSNFEATYPSSVVNYIEAHDNLTLYDVIAKATHKNPLVSHKDIMQRVRLGNFMLLTSQGTAFMQAGQEYGRSRHLKTEVLHKDQGFMDIAMILKDEDGNLFQYPYIIHNAYHSSDALNSFKWEKIMEDRETVLYTQGLIELRRSVSEFHFSTRAEIDENVRLLKQGNKDDLIIAYQIKGELYDYFVFVNADNKTRKFKISESLKTTLVNAEVLCDKHKSGNTAIANPQGFAFKEELEVDPLCGLVFRGLKV